MGEGDIPGDVRGSDKSDTRRRLTVAQAAEALGVTVDAVRSRIKRETIDYVREGGRVYVMLGADQGATSTDQDFDQGDDHVADQPTNVHPGRGDRDELVEELRDRVRALEEANRENRRIIAALTSRIPEIEAPRGEPHAPETGSEGESGAEAPSSDTEEPRRSWWRRVFGFE
jgi:hypothetical protein